MIELSSGDDFSGVCASCDDDDPDVSHTSDEHDGHEHDECDDGHDVCHDAQHGL